MHLNYKLLRYEYKMRWDMFFFCEENSIAAEFINETYNPQSFVAYFFEKFPALVFLKDPILSEK